MYEWNCVKKAAEESFSTQAMKAVFKFMRQKQGDEEIMWWVSVILYPMSSPIIFQLKTCFGTQLLLRTHSVATRVEGQNFSTCSVDYNQIDAMITI